jgi:hypothetical protein
MCTFKKENGTLPESNVPLKIKKVLLYEQNYNNRPRSPKGWAKK